MADPMHKLLSKKTIRYIVEIEYPTQEVEKMIEEDEKYENSEEVKLKQADDQKNEDDNKERYNIELQRNREKHMEMEKTEKEMDESMKTEFIGGHIHEQIKKLKIRKL
jgi:hypothetical protein